MRTRIVTGLLAVGLTLTMLPAHSAADHDSGGDPAVDKLIHMAADASASVKAKLDALSGLERLDVVTVSDMFEMQMLMNHLSQLSEMSTSVMAAANHAIASMARNVRS